MSSSHGGEAQTQSWRKCLREEFRLKKFGFGDVYPGRFHMWQWRIPPVVYLLYRLVLAVYVDVWLVYLFSEASQNTDSNPDISWAAYLTNWTYTVLAIYQTTHFTVSGVHYLCFKRQETQFFKRPLCDSHQNMFPETFLEPWGAQKQGYDPVPDLEIESEFRQHKTPWYLIILWILFSVVSSAALMVTLVFFAFLFPTMTDAKAGSVDNVQLHMLNSVIVFIEHLVSGIPIRLLHVIYPIMYGLVYMLFSLFYWIPDHKRVLYEGVLDWNNAGKTVGMIFLIGIVIIPVLHTIFFIIYRLKLAIYKRVG